jgi:alpha-tubulin suppressor-like RCC1 family protein
MARGYLQGFTMLLHRLVTFVVAFSTAFAPMASADVYVFRYNTNLIGIEQPAPPEEQYGEGNDITAYYVAPTNENFSKKIPVATHDVTRWVKDSGDWPAGIGLDVSTGQMSGTPTEAGKQVLLYYGYDAEGHRIARAQLNFTVFTPVGVGEKLAYYAHTGQYFFQTIPLPSEVGVYRWMPIDPDAGYPDGMSLVGKSFQGTPTKAGTYGLGWIGYDYLDRPVAYAAGEFLVEDHPAIEQIPDQVADKTKGEFFRVVPVVPRSIGTLVYSLVPENGRPDGLAFNFNTGIITGVYKDFDTTASFHIDVTDSADGTTGSSKSFKLTTLPAVIDLCCIGQPDGLVGYVGKSFMVRLKQSVTAPGATWSITAGALPAGLHLHPDLGYIYGTPETKETHAGVVVTVAGAGTTTESSNPFKITIYPEELIATFKPVVARVGASFASKGPKITSANVPPFKASVAPGSTLAQGLRLDTDTGVVSSDGMATAGTYDVPLALTNADGENTTAIQPIGIFNLLSIGYADATVKRLKPLALAPVVDTSSVIGAARYSISGNLPSWLSFSKTTGRFSGTPVLTSAVGPLGPFVVTISDETGEQQPSNPFYITVSDRDPLGINILGTEAQRFVENQVKSVEAIDAYLDARFSLTTGTLGSAIGSKLRITEDGYLVGTTSDPIGTVYTGLVVTATDQDGDSALTAPFSITVVAPKDMKPLTGALDTALKWTRGVPFSLVLPSVSNAYGTVAYGIDDPSFVVNSQSATVTGTVTASGVYTHVFTVADETVTDGLRAAATGSLTLTMLDPMTATLDTVYTFNKGSAIPDIVPVIENAIGQVSYTFTGTLPKGLSYSNGKVTGTPTEQGEFGPLQVLVEDGAGTTVLVGFSIKIGAPLPFGVSYPGNQMIYGQMSRLMPTLINPLGAVSYSITAGTLPAGINFDGAGTLKGAFYGTPTESGRFPLTIHAVDGSLDTASSSDDVSVDISVDLLVTKAGDAGLADKSFTVRAGVPFTVALAADNVVAPLKFKPTDPAGLPYGLVLNAFTGALTGSFPETGTYEGVGVAVTDSMGRPAEGTFSFVAVGDVSVSAPSTMTFKHFTDSSVAVSTPNIVGMASYALSSDSPDLPAGLAIDPATGAVHGAPEDVGDFPGYVIVVTDSFDGTSAPTARFSIHVDERDALVLTPPAAVSVKRYGVVSGSASTISEIGLVAYSVVPELPDGITLDQATGALSGSSNDLVPQAVYTVTAMDSKGGVLGTDNKTFTLSVSERDPLMIDFPLSISFKQHESSTKSAAVTSPVGNLTWTLDPDLPEGLHFLDGSIIGQADDAFPSTHYTMTAVDAKGGALGTATSGFDMTVDARDPLTPWVPASYAFNQYFDGAVSATAANVLGKAHWTITPDLPTWLAATTDSVTGDLTLSGIPDDLMDSTTYQLVVTDDWDSSAQQPISIKVDARRPLKIAADADAPAVIKYAGLLGYPLGVTLAADNSRGAVTWALVSGALPDGVTLNADTGQFEGAATAFADFRAIVISATDAKGGFDQRTFEFDIGQDGSPIVLAPPALTSVHVDAFVTTPAPESSNVVGQPTWSAAGLSGTGLTINPATGIISGTPTVAGTITAMVSLSDVTGRSVAPVAQTIVVLPAVTITSASPLSLTYNYDPTTATPVAVNSVGPNTWTLKSGKLPKNVTVDPATGNLVGKPGEVGDFGPIVLSVTDSLGGQASSAAIPVHVGMNGDIIALAVTDFATHAGYAIRTAPPVYSNELGSVTFSSPDAVALGLSIDPSTGIVTGSVSTFQDVRVNISIKDSGTTRVTSRPLHLQVLPPMQLVLPSSRNLEALARIADISVVPQYAVGSIAYGDVSDPSLLPSGVTFDKIAGKFVGTPTDLGTFGPVTVTGTDATNDTEVSNSITFTVKPGSKYIGLSNSPLADATKRTAYSFDFKSLTTLVGVNDTDVAYVISPSGTNIGQILPPGLTGNGSVLSGNPTLSGSYTFTVTAKPADTASTLPAVTKTYVLKVVIPSAAIALPPLPSLPAGEALKAYSYDIGAATNFTGGLTTSNVAWTVVLAGANDALPPGVTLIGGVLAGTPTKGGDYTFSIKAEYKDSEEDVSDLKAYTLSLTGLGYAFTQIDGSIGGSAAACGITPTGGAQCWGLNGAGQVGDGTLNDALFAVDVSGLTSGVRSVAVGSSGACAVLSNGTVDCWGSGGNGQLGNGALVASPTPVQVSGISTATMAAGGGTHFCAALSEGGVKCWGRSSGNTLGDGSTLQSATPVPVANIGARHVISLAASGSATCAVLDDQTVWCWGSNVSGGTGLGTTSGNTFVPTQVPGLLASKISGGSSWFCVVTKTGGAQCWGANNVGQLGDGTATTKASPTTVSGLTSGVTDIHAGLNHTCAIRAGGAKCWGTGAQGQLGNGTINDTANPVDVTGLTSGVVQIMAGYNSSCALLSSGSPKCWGVNAGIARGTKTGTSLVPVNMGTQ